MQRSSLKSQDWHHRSADQTLGLVAAVSFEYMRWRQNSFSKCGRPQACRFGRSSIAPTAARHNARLRRAKRKRSPRLTADPVLVLGKHQRPLHRRPALPRRQHGGVSLACAAYDQVVRTSDVALLVAGLRGGRRPRSRLGGSRRSRR